MVVPPVYVFVLVKINVPVPACVTEPVPEITSAYVTTSLRAKDKLALLTTPPAPKLPLVAPLPT